MKLLSAARDDVAELIRGAALAHLSLRPWVYVNYYRELVVISLSRIQNIGYVDGRKGKGGGGGVGGLVKVFNAGALRFIKMRDIPGTKLEINTLGGARCKKKKEKEKEKIVYFFRRVSLNCHLCLALAPRGEKKS